MQFFT